MESVVRGFAVYVFIWVVFRISGKRTLSQATTFDFALLLIISETTQQAMIGNDQSITNGFLLIITLVGVDIVVSLLKQRSHALDRLMEGLPLVIVENGRPLKQRMDKSRVDEQDVLAAAREAHGLERLEQIKYAVLERSGGISIVPTDQAG